MFMDRLLAASSRAYHQSAFVRLLLAQINEPTAETTLALERTAVQLARPEDVESYLSALRSNPATIEMLRDRYLAKPYTVDDLSKYGEGTLARAYCDHMIANDLRPDYFQPIDASNDYNYVRLRLLQTHDLWHVVTGYRTDVPGEVSIVGFYLGHFDRHLPKDGHKAMVFTAMLAGTTLLHAALKKPELLPPFYRGLVDGWQRGQAAKPFFAIKWEEMWDRPLDEVRAHCNLEPARGLSS